MSEEWPLTRRLSKGLAIEFRIRSKRKLFQVLEGGGDHVVGQGGSEGLAQRGRAQIVAAGIVGDQTFVARTILAQDDGGARDARDFR